MLATIVLARRVVAWPLALAAGLIAAVTPLVAFHAQLLKEDIFLAPWLLFALAALDRLRENAETRRALAFGLLVGLATSAKYIGVVLLPLACVVPLIAPVTTFDGIMPRSPVRSERGRGVRAHQRAGVPDAGDLPARPDHGIAHALSEPHHRLARLVFVFPASLDHEPVARPRPAAGASRSRRSASGLRRWRSSAPAIRLVLLFAVLWYFLHELSPMKPFMAIERHMTVMGGLFAVLAVDLFARLAAAPVTWRPALAAGASALWPRRLPSPPSPSPVPAARYPHHVERCERRSTAAMPSTGTLRSPPTDITRRYRHLTAPPSTSCWCRNRRSLRQSSAFPHQSARVRAYARAYSELLAQPAILVESTAGSFSYRNVPLRIVALAATPHGSTPCSPNSARCPTSAYAAAGRGAAQRRRTTR